jgi:parvulin-like peptidyl-prolyl isomerase
MGMPFEDFKAQVKNQLLTQRVIGEEISSRVVIPEPEKRKYYDEHKKDFVREEQVFLRQILISTEGKSPDQVAAAERKAKDLVARARKGEKFSDLAATNSDDLETARNGGELPAFKRGQLMKQIEDIVFKQPKGYVTDPIRGQNGFLILKIEERYEKGQATFEEVDNEINEKMMMPQMNAKVRVYLTKLRQDAFLEIKTGYVDSGAAPGKDTSWKDVAQLKPQTVTKQEVAERRRRKRLLWVVPVPGTGGSKKSSTAPQSAAAPPAGGAPVSASAPPAAAPAQQ